MTIAQVQTNALEVYTTGFAATWASAPTLGSLLVCVIRNNNGTTIAAHTISSAGWTRAPHVESVSNAVSIWWKVAGASEPSVVGSTSSGIADVYLSEWTSSTGWPATPIDVSASFDSNPTNVTDTVTGTTAATAQTVELLVGVWSKNLGASWTISTAGWTKVAENANHNGPWGYKITSSTGTQTATATSTASVTAAAAIAAFKPTVVAPPPAATGSYVGVLASGVVTPTVPTAPISPVGVAGNGQATVSWSPANNGGYPIDSYTITSSVGGQVVTVAGTVLSTIVPGLTNGTAYTFTVVATNRLGAGPGATTGSVTPTITVPGAPSNVAADTLNGDRRATVTFTAPTVTGGSAISGYTATSTPGSITGTASSSPVLVTGLTAGTAYTFTVHATNGSGNSPESAASNAVTAVTVPAAPTPAVASQPGNASALVTWAPPASTGSSPITGYHVVSNDGAHTWDAQPTDRSVLMTFLTNGQAYTFTVTAVNAVGSSSGATTGSVTPVATSPGPPTGVVAQAGNGQATVSWTAPTSPGDAPLASYNVYTTAAATTAVATVGAGTTQVTVSGLSNGTTYQFWVTASNTTPRTSSVSQASNAVTPSSSTTSGQAQRALAILYRNIGPTASSPNGKDYALFVSAWLNGRQTPLVVMNAALDKSSDFAACWQDIAGWNDFPNYTQTINGTTYRGWVMRPIIAVPTVFPGDFPGVSAYDLQKKAAQGQWAAMLTAWAKNLHDAGITNPYIRAAWEADASWYAWSAQLDKIDADHSHGVWWAHWKVSRDAIKAGCPGATVLLCGGLRGLATRTVTDKRPNGTSVNVGYDLGVYNSWEAFAGAGAGGYSYTDGSGTHVVTTGGDMTLPDGFEADHYDDYPGSTGATTNYTTKTWSDPTKMWTDDTYPRLNRLGNLAAKYGKPIAMGEWALSAGFTHWDTGIGFYQANSGQSVGWDNVQWVQGIHDFMDSFAGGVAYYGYFNQSLQDSHVFQILTDGNPPSDSKLYPNASARFRTLYTA